MSLSKLTGVVLAMASLTALAACETDPDRFTAPGGAGVYQINSNVFEVVGSSPYGASLYWCGASNYARRVLGASWSQPITISRSLGVSQATGRVSSVQFTLNPGALGIATEKRMDPNTLAVGDTKTVTEGDFYCDRLRFRNV